MPASDREVFQHLTSDPNQSEVSNFLTYAQFAFDRREWIAYRTQEDGREPTEEMIAAWTADQTPHDFEQLRLRAASFFDYAARDYMQPEIKAAGDDALRSGVLREVASAVEVQKAGLAATLAEVRSAGAFRKQFGIALLTAILAPLLIGAAIGAALIFNDRLPTIRDVAKAVAAPPAPPAATPDK